MGVEEDSIGLGTVEKASVPMWRGGSGEGGQCLGRSGVLHESSQTPGFGLCLSWLAGSPLSPFGNGFTFSWLQTA